MAGMYGCFKGRNSDSAAMASGPPDVMANQEPAEVQEECSGKKKSKFQTFKKLFARKKRKEPSGAEAEAGIKASQSTENVSKTSENNALTRSEKDKGSGSKISLGNKALSHDSVFVSDSSEANEAMGASQDSIHGKVKSLQLQLKQAIRLGSPPSLMCVKRTEDAGTMSEDDGLPCSPPEYTPLHTAMAQRNSFISLDGIDSDDDQLACAASSRAMSPLVVPGDFSQPASPFGCLDNSAAKHKRGLRLKACNKRKPVSKLEGKMEGDSMVDEMLNTSVTDAAEEQEKQMSEAVSFDQLKPKVEREEEEEEEGEGDMEEEKARSQHSRQSLLRYKEEMEDESEAEQDVSHSPDISSPLEPSLSEEEAPDAQPPPSSEPSSRASSLDSPRATPEPPTGPREYLLDPPGIAYGAEKSRVESELSLRADEDDVQENEEEEEEEEGSFLQEVLSSLKTPLTSCSLRLDTEDDVMEMKEETNEKEEEVVEMEDAEEVEEEEAEEDEPVGYQAAPSLMLGHTTEKKEEVSVLSIEEEVALVEEEAESDEEEAAAAEEEEEELVVELFIQHSEEEAAAEKEEVEEVEPEEDNYVFSRNSEIHAQGERREKDGEREEDVMELENGPQVDEEESEKRKEDEEEEEEEEEEEDEEMKEVSSRVEEAEEAIEEESDEAEEMMENLPDAADEEVWITTSLQERDEGVEAVVRDDSTEHSSDDEILTDLGDQVVDKVQEGEENSEIVVEGEEIEISEEKSDREDDVETKLPDVDETEEENTEELSSVDTIQEDQTEATASVPAHPSSLSLQDLPYETLSEEKGAVSPSKTSMIHINLISPSSEKAPSFFQQSPTTADINDNITEPPSHLEAATEKEEQADTVEEVQEEKQSALEEQEVEEEATPPASVEETANRPSSGSDQGKVRFTITPAWQRSQSLTPPSSPPAVASSSTSAAAGPGTEEVEAAVKKDPGVKAEPASSPKVDLVLSPGRVRNAGSTAVKPQSNTTTSPPCIKPPAPAAVSTEESTVVAEGNPDNPFGVRLRKTSTLHLFSSEEENTESPIESPIQPTSCKAEPPQPIGVKPSISLPISNKPALPKKPDVHGDSGVKTKCISDPVAAARGVSAGSDSPSWISVAKQKQRIYKENSLEEITVKKDEPERKSSLPMHVSSVASREHSTKTAESSSKEMSKPSASVEKETRRALSPPTPVPAQPSKNQSLPCPVPPKPLVAPAAAKPPAQPTLDHRPTLAPVPHKSPSCTSPPPLSKPATFSPSSKAPQPQSTTPSTPFSSRTAPEKSASRAAGVPGQTPSSQRGMPPAALPQDEPPWMALAKKKAKAWSEMPQIVQ